MKRPNWKARLKEIRKRLRGEPEIKRLIFNEGMGLDLAATHPITAYIAAEMGSFFKSAGGQNYVEIRVNHEELGPLVLTMQRAHGKTPHELKAEAVESAKALAGALENLVNEIVEYNPTNIDITAARAALDKAKGER